MAQVAVPLIISGVGIVSVVTGAVIVRITGTSQEDETNKNALMAASILFGISIIFVIITIVLLIYYLKTSLTSLKRAKRVRTARVFFIIGVIVTFLTLITAAVITFVTANKIEESSPDEARNLRGAAGSALIGIIIFTSVFVYLWFKYGRNVSKALKYKKQSNI